MCFGSLKYFFVNRAKRRVFYRAVFARAFPFPLYNSMHASFFVKKIASKIFKDMFDNFVRQMHFYKKYKLIIFNGWGIANYI